MSWPGVTNDDRIEPPDGPWGNAGHRRLLNSIGGEQQKCAESAGAGTEGWFCVITMTGGRSGWTS